jgi:hypothetical protein
MNIYDIMIGFIIGVGVERALKLSYILQKMIKEAKENKKKQQARKKAEMNIAYGKKLAETDGSKPPS